jgi:uncharacterized protein with ATP-grasp and redox domains
MKLNFHCISCFIDMALKVIDMLSLSEDLKEKIIRDELRYLSEEDYLNSIPECIGKLWDIILKHIDNDDPYEEQKQYYDLEVLKIYGELDALLNKAEDVFISSLKVAILGNLIDFAANNNVFNMDRLKQNIANAGNIPLVIDDSKKMYQKLKSAKLLLYLGDNCGEIVLDKLFIQLLRREFPALKIYFSVRGKPIMNDVTRKDADLVGMGEVAEVIDNGDGSLGTVLRRVPQQFKDLYYKADVVISKGQGNYESLWETDRGNVFFMLIVKCLTLAGPLGIQPMSVVCMENGTAYARRQASFPAV